MSKALSFEEQLKALEAIVTRLEQGEIPLEEAIKHYEEGMTLIAQAEDKLNAAQKVLTKKLEQGEEVEFDAERS